MAYTTVPTVTTGELWTAADHNTYVRDNFAATAVGLATTAGQIPYATGPLALAMLALGAQDHYFKAGPSGPQWVKDAGLISVPFGNFAEVIPAGLHEGSTPVPWPVEIEKWYLELWPAGSLQVDIWVSDFSEYDAGSTHPADGDSICGGNEPAVSSAAKASDSTLTSWTKSHPAESEFWFYVDSAVTCQWARLDLFLKKKGTS